MTNTESFDIESLVTFMQDDMGINPFTIYCQLTGKPIGRISPDELEPFLTGDVDVVAHDLFVRIIASMRPSIHWNVMRESTLADMAKSRPIETLAYLLNRLFAPVDFFKLPLARRLEDQHQRIRLYQFLVDMQPEVRESLYAMLIEIDAKMNLSQQKIELRAVDFMLFLDDSMQIIADFHADRMKIWLRQQKHAEAESRFWLKGNTAAKPAFFASWVEAKPETKTAAKKRVKKENDAELDALFDAVMAESAEAAFDVVEPVLPRPATPAPSKPAASLVTRGAPSFLNRSK